MSKDPADPGYKAPEPAGRDDEAEQQEAQRALVSAHGESGPPEPPPPPDEYPEGEPVPGYHPGPPERLNCAECGHAHDKSYSGAKCKRCKAVLPDLEKAKAAYKPPAVPA